MVTTVHYRLCCVANVTYRVENADTPACPICGGKLKPIGSRKRNLRMTNGKRIFLIVRRLRCADCDKIHHELPDLIVPYKQFCVSAIETVTANPLGAVDCDESTVRRLRDWYLRQCSQLLKILAAKSRDTQTPPAYIFDPLGGKAGWLRKATPFLSANLLWVQTRFAC